MREKYFSEFGLQFIKGKAIPLAGHWDITGVCNLDCVHCYRSPRGRDAAVNTRRSLELIGEIAQFGCLTLTLSGGEPLTHPEFKQIYAAIRAHGIQVILFTNAVLVNEDLVDWLADSPPLMIEVTLHSLKEDVFERITRVKGSFQACLRGIKLVASRRLPLTIKTVCMRDNKDEIACMREFAVKNKAQFKFDPYLIAPFHLPQLAEKYRLSADEVVTIEAKDYRILKQWNECLADYCCMSRQDDPSPFCSAGLYNFHINSNLQLGLCHLLNQPRFNLTGKTFKEGFTGLLSAERDRLYYRPADCLDCPADVFCGQCPARADIECNDPQAKVQYLCDLAKKRYEVFKPILEPTV